MIESPLPSSVMRVLRFVAAEYGTTSQAIRGERQDALIAPARHLCCYILVRKCGWSTVAVGKFLNHHHASVMYGVNRVETGISNDAATARIIREFIVTLALKPPSQSRRRWRPPEQHVLDELIEVWMWRFQLPAPGPRLLV